MKKRFKIVLSFCMLFVACALMVGMVYAATSVSVTINSTISYTAPENCEVKISGRIANAYNSAGTALSGAGYTTYSLLFDSTKTGDFGETEGSWSPDTVYFNPDGTQTLIYYIKVENYSSAEVAYNLSRTSTTTFTNCTEKINPSAGTISQYSGTGTAPSVELTITYTITNTSQEISVTQPSYKLALEREAYKGAGTETDPYIISSVNDYTEYFINNSPDGLYFKQTADLVDVPQVTQAIAINYDGNNYSISVDEGKSMFKFIYGDDNTGAGAYIKNLTITSNISNIDTLESSNFAGGIAGYCAGLFIDNCIFNGSINISGSSSIATAGGFVGLVDGVVLITNSQNTGNIVVQNEGYAFAGGFIGSSNVDCSVYNSYNTGTISANGSLSFAGGILGGIGSGNSMIFNSYNIGAVNATTVNGRAAGIIGGSIGSAINNVKNCYNAGTITGETAANAIVAYEETAGTYSMNYYKAGTVSDTRATSVAEATFNSSTFATTLTNNANSIDLKTEVGIYAVYITEPLKAWISTGSNPTFGAEIPFA